MNDYIERATRAYLKMGGPELMQPSYGTSGVEEVEGKLYIVLRNVYGVLVVYRIGKDGYLCGLNSWPSSIAG